MTITPNEVRERLALIRVEIETLIEDIEAHVDRFHERRADLPPDTRRLFESRWALGDAKGLSVALAALELDDATVTRALEAPAVQRDRGRRMTSSSARNPVFVRSSNPAEVASRKRLGKKNTRKVRARNHESRDVAAERRSARKEICTS